MIKEQDKFDKVKPKLDNVLEQITADEIEQRINIDEQEEAIENLESLKNITAINRNRYVRKKFKKITRRHIHSLIYAKRKRQRDRT